MRNKLCLWVRGLKKHMNKFYHGEQLGFAYKATGEGCHRIPLLRSLPYLTGRKVKIRVSLKSLYNNQEWRQGVLRYEPPIILHPELAKDDIFKEFEKNGDVFLLDNSQRWLQSSQQYVKYKFETGKWWSKTIAVKDGEIFIRPYSFKCNLILQNMEFTDNKLISSTETAEIRVADISVISENKFWGWALAIIIPSIVAIITAIIIA